MTNLTPAANVQAAFAAGVVVTIAQHVMSSYGLSLSPDAANGLTASITLLVAHIWDVVTGQNVKAS